MRFFRWMWVGVAALCLAIPPARADYVFLGNVRESYAVGSGVTLICENHVQLRVEFLRAEMLRVSLQRPEDTEPLLDYPLVPARWDSVPLVRSEDPHALILRSDSLELLIQRAPCRLLIRNLRGDTLCMDDSGLGIGWDGGDVRVWKQIAQGEKFYGLGLKGGNVDKRGQEWVMWNTDFPAYTDRTDPLYQSVPFFMGLRGGNAYGIYLNNCYRTRFNLGAGNLRYYAFGAEQGPLDYFFIYGPRPADVLAHYTELTGRISLPPLWALGYQQSRWSYYPEAEVLRLAETFRAKEIPADVIYLDIHYMNGYRVFTWDKERFPDPKGLLARLAKLGFKVVPIIDPGVKADSAYAVAQEGLVQNHFVLYPDSQTYVGEVWPGPSYFPDFSRDRTREWWASWCSRLRETGVRGFWNDMNEPAVWGQAFPPEVLFFDEGRVSSQKKLHNLYGLLMAKATYEGLRRHHPNERPFILTRAGFAGTQRYAAAWTGDNVSSDEHLELGIRMMLGMGLSGQPFVGTDIGGFMGTPSPELYARWIEVGALSPFCRTHTHHNSADQEPWSFGEQVEEISRTYISLRYRLLPYFYSLFHEAAETGTPLWRPLFWYHGDDERSFAWEFQHQFFLGANLLAAPVTRSTATMKKVFLPRGRWLNVHTEEVLEGPGTVTVDAPLERLPLFLREGGIVPLRDPVQYADEKPVRELTLEIFAGADLSFFDLYEDDGKSFDYERGEHRLTRFTCQGTADEIRFAREVRHNRYQPSGRDLVLRFHGVTRKPQQVLEGERELKSSVWSYDEASRMVTVRLDEKRDRQQVALYFWE